MNAIVWLEKVAAWIWQTSWQASVLVALVLLVQWLFARKLAPAWRCGLWLLVVVRLLLPVAPGSPISVFNWVRLAPVSTPALRFPRHDQFANDEQNQFQASIAQAETSDHAAAASEPAMASPASFRSTDALSPKTILSLIWFVGAALFAAGLIWQYWRLNRRLAAATSVLDPAVRQNLEEARHAVGLRRSPALLETDQVSSPALFGCRHVRLLLPRGLSAVLTSRELRHVFLHEAAHLKRGICA